MESCSLHFETKGTMHTNTIEEMLKALRPVIKKKDRALSLLEKYWSDKIALVWTAEDVFRAANERELPVTPEEARQVLNHLLDNHDAQYGLKWQDITDYIDERVLGRAMTKREIHRFVHKDIITINKKETTKPEPDAGLSCVWPFGLNSVQRIKKWKPRFPRSC